MPNKNDTLLSALQEVLDDVKSQQKLSQREVNIENIDVVNIRKKYHLSQPEFSKTFGFSLSSLQKWEQGSRKPHGSVRILLKVIEHAPEVVKEALHQ